jgi:hypothetical protein
MDFELLISLGGLGMWITSKAAWVVSGVLVVARLMGVTLPAWINDALAYVILCNMICEFASSRMISKTYGE